MPLVSPTFYYSRLRFGASLRLRLTSAAGSELHSQSCIRDMSQISRDKFDCFRYATAGLPPASLMEMDFVVIGRLARRRKPLTRFLSIGSYLCSTLPFRPHLAVTPLRLATLHIHQVGDLHPLAVEHARRTNRHRGSGRPLSPATPPYMRVRIRRFGGYS